MDLRHLHLFMSSMNQKGLQCTCGPVLPSYIFSFHIFSKIFQIAPIWRFQLASGHVRCPRTRVWNGRWEATRCEQPSPCQAPSTTPTARRLFLECSAQHDKCLEDPPLKWAASRLRFDLISFVPQCVSGLQIVLLTITSHPWRNMAFRSGIQPCEVALSRAQHQ